MGGGGGWDYDYSEEALTKSSKVYEAEARATGTSRAYQGKEAKGVPPPVGRSLATVSPTPLVVAVDVTGSMKQWPKVIFEKLPVLYNEAKLYLPEVEISFVAVGDANVDHYPLQVCDFRKGRELEEGINAIYPEGGGGAGTRETYELAAYFFARHCEMKNARQGLFVFCGDEGFYETIKVNMVKRMTGEDVPADLDSYEVLRELQERFQVYILRVPYDNPAKDKEIQEQWETALGPQVVLRLEDPRRIVDTIIGLVAVAAQEGDSFAHRLALRQTEDQVKQVMATLHPVLAAEGETADGEVEK